MRQRRRAQRIRAVMQLAEDGYHPRREWTAAELHSATALWSFTLFYKALAMLIDEGIVERRDRWFYRLTTTALMQEVW